jgi:hypothetical protein
MVELAAFGLQKNFKYILDALREYCHQREAKRVIGSGYRVVL